MLETLLKNSRNPNAEDDCGISVIFYVAGTVKFDSLKILVKVGANVNALNGFYKQTPLLWLIDTYDIRFDGIENQQDLIYGSIKFLIEHGANVNLKIKSMESPLIKAVEQKKLRLIELLIASGAEINYRDGADRTAYSYAAESGDKEIKEILIKAGADVKIGVKEYQKEWGENAFFQAAADGRTDVVEAMIALGTNVNSVNIAGKMTALMRTHEFSTVDSLLAAGADVNLKDISGHTALMWAVLFRNHGIVQKLIAAGADVNIRNLKGDSALDLVLDDKTKEMLIKAGAKQNN